LATGELVKLLDLGACDLGEMSDPVTAAAADYDTVLKTQLALVSVRLLLQNMLWAESDSRKERNLRPKL
jgi:hypothetical protein